MTCKHSVGPRVVAGMVFRPLELYPFRLVGHSSFRWDPDELSLAQILPRPRFDYIIGSFWTATLLTATAFAPYECTQLLPHR